VDLAKPTASVPEISVPGQPEVNAAYIPVDVPLAGSEGPDIRNVHIRLTSRQAVAYRRLRAGLVSLGERLDDGRLDGTHRRGVLPLSARVQPLCGGVVPRAQVVPPRLHPKPSGLKATLRQAGELLRDPYQVPGLRGLGGLHEQGVLLLVLVARGVDRLACGVPLGEVVAASFKPSDEGSDGVLAGRAEQGGGGLEQLALRGGAGGLHQQVVLLAVGHGSFHRTHLLGLRLVLSS
jgi:hypothetical protein